MIHVASDRHRSRSGRKPVTASRADAAYFRIGWAGEWTVRERLRKVHVVHKEA